MNIHLPDHAAQEAFGARLAGLLTPPFDLYLEGELGTGKTTLTRGLLRALGHGGAVRSPTYTLLEPYPLALGTLYHLDLYRLGDPGELEELGLRDLLTDDAIRVVEWPERGVGVLPAPDLTIRLTHDPAGRRLRLLAGTARGAALIAALMA